MKSPRTHRPSGGFRDWPPGQSFVTSLEREKRSEGRTTLLPVTRRRGGAVRGAEPAHAGTKGLATSSYSWPTNRLVKGVQGMNKKLMIGTLLVLALAVFVAGCGRSGGAAGLDGTKWVLTSLNGDRPLEGREVTLAFDGGKASGSAGCNSYFGGYEVQGEDKLTFSEVGSTEMACLDPEGIMGQEEEYLTALRGATGFRVSDGKLQIFSAGGGVLAFSQAQ